MRIVLENCFADRVVNLSSQLACARRGEGKHGGGAWLVFWAWRTPEAAVALPLFSAGWQCPPSRAVCEASSCCSSSLPRAKEGDEEASCGVGPASHRKACRTRGWLGPACCCRRLQPGQCSHPRPRPAGALRVGEATGPRTCSFCVRSRRVSAGLQRRLWVLPEVPRGAPLLSRALAQGRATLARWVPRLVCWVPLWWGR